MQDKILLSVALGVMVMLAAIAAFTDVRTRRIPNAICAAVFLSGIALHTLAGGHAVLDAAAAAGVVLVVGIPLVTIRAFGAGDIKLFAACAAVAGTHGLPSLLLAVSACGAVLTVIVAIHRRCVVSVVASTLAAAAGRPGRSGLVLPYGVAVAAGAAAYSMRTLFVSQ